MVVVGKGRPPLSRRHMYHKIEKITEPNSTVSSRRVQHCGFCEIHRHRPVLPVPGKTNSSESFGGCEHVPLCSANHRFLLSNGRAQCHSHKHIVLRAKEAQRCVSLSPTLVLSKAAAARCRGKRVCEVAMSRR